LALIGITLFAFAAPAACGGSGSSGEFSTLAYNVAGLPQEVSQVNPEEHIPMISPLLNDYDIVLTQEDFDWWVPSLDTFDFANYHTRLRGQTTHPYASERHPGPEAVGLDVEADRPGLMVGDGLGILSRYPFDEFRRVPWEGCAPAAADCLAMKGFGMARVSLDDGVVIDVYTLHAEAGSEDDDDAVRAAGYEHLADYIERESAGNAIILGGDTNLHTDPADPDHPDDYGVWQAFLERTGLIDVCDALSCPEPERIDKFAYRNGGGVELEPLLWQFEAEKFTDAQGEALSDHEPLLVRWKWKAD
jgi:hypothetical protein